MVTKIDDCLRLLQDMCVYQSVVVQLIMVNDRRLGCGASHYNTFRYIKSELPNLYPFRKFVKVLLEDAINVVQRNFTLGSYINFNKGVHFSNRVINSLPDFIVNTNSLDSFKNLPDEYWTNYHYFCYD